VVPETTEIRRMDTQQIKEIVRNGIATLKAKDYLLLKNDISERAISHKLAVYLNDKFPGLDVDCEYNGHAKSDNNKKYIMILRQRIKELGKLRDSDKDDELLKRSVYPDIIVHKRAKERNLLIIEIKKINNADAAFDREKVCRYTSPEDENHLNYELGALIIFTTGKEEIPHTIEWYKDGNKTDEE
jgi:hypothetical protein